MPCDNPTGGGSLAALNLPAKHVPILRSCLNDWLHGVREDLNAPERLQHPDRARQEAQEFERLVLALVLREHPTLLTLPALASPSTGTFDTGAGRCRQPSSPWM